MSLLSQQSKTDGVKGSQHDAVGDVTHQRVKLLSHVSCGPPGKGHGQQGFRCDVTPSQQRRESNRQRSGFSRPGPRQNEHGILTGEHRVTLFFIQRRKQVRG